MLNFNVMGRRQSAGRRHEALAASGPYLGSLVIPVRLGPIVRGPTRSHNNSTTAPKPRVGRDCKLWNISRNLQPAVMDGITENLPGL